MKRTNRNLAQRLANENHWLAQLVRDFSMPEGAPAAQLASFVEDELDQWQESGLLVYGLGNDGSTTNRIVKYFEPVDGGVNRVAKWMPSGRTIHPQPFEHN